MAELIDTIISNTPLEEIKKLCQLNVLDVNYFNGETTPLHSATEYFEDGIVDLIKFLVEEGADINMNRIECTVLAKCVRNGLRLEVIDKLLELGANPNIKDSQGRNALHLSVHYYPDDEQQTLALVHLLLHHGVDYEADKYDGCTPLMDFIRFGNHSRVVKYLLSCGADPNASDLNSNTALHYCCDWNWLFKDNMDSFNLEVLKSLLFHGGDLFSKNCDNETPLDNFFKSSSVFGSSTINFEPMMYEILKFMAIKEQGGKTNEYGNHYNNNNMGEIQMKKEESFTEMLFLTEEYVQELNELKLYVLFEDTSLFTLCSLTNRRKLGIIYKRIESIHSITKVNNDIKQFKNYSKLLETRLKIGRDWSIMFKKLENMRLTFWVVKDGRFVILHYDCIQYLLLFLNKLGIENLITASNQGIDKNGIAVAMI